MAPTRIAVIGSGIGAWTAALALSRKHAVELFSGAAPANRGLGLWPAATQHLLALGVDLDECRKIPPAAYRNKRGKWLSSAPLNSETQRMVTSVELHPLLRQLKNACADRVQLHHQKAIISQSQGWDYET